MMAGKAGIGLRLATVLVLALMSAGCVSRAAMQKMADQLDYLEASQKRMERDLLRVDSLVTAASASSVRTAADVGSSLEEFGRETRALREAVSELRKEIDRRPPQVIYKPAPTKAPDTASGGATADAGNTPPSPDIDPSQLYENAFLDVRKGNYELAIEQFRDVLEFFGDTEYAPHARYWIGECLYSMEKYDSATAEFDVLITSFPDSDRIPTALYKMGRCYEELGRPRRARIYYQRVINEYPNSLEAKPSQSRLTQIK